ncbi:nicotinate-nucleotide--dimethylbenzimidazole phosphoribosyltransferase [Desmospora profundinema]|uniref:Nicotinate-nucleotide--dimethylbenzimidazole phosphoribosyltransferase n=1 Tax=Desmospora profundinema TaxID=1571184 RepID=A0ABU1IMU1_9BACL|nr:nicotinate-nucleotide--dimethylbenzimidazole phosphoribosyltransferase [Desmospora profundinema]MDR6226099.1 nicotinate-nucleotide--dimethylbenzimidazole phosphoribosyltransferase [Desmospora profundinema]
MEHRLIEETILSIPPLDEKTQTKARHHVDNLTKPLGALGRLEEVVVRLAGMTGEIIPVIDRKMTVVMCGDHGVVEEGVSAYPGDVTALMIQNFSRGKAAVNVLSRQFGADVRVVDVGSRLEEAPPDVWVRKVRSGTANMAVGPAMTREEAEQAVKIGIDVAKQLKEEGVQLVATGEMGIGNTTAASALAAVFTEREVSEVVGRGSGLDDTGLERKCRVVKEALRVNRPDPRDPLDALAKVGGLELAGLAGLVLGAASERLPIVVDGFIATAAALTAVRMAPAAREYLLASHLSQEPAHGWLLAELRLVPLIQAGMRLGEGSGAVLTFPLLDGAVATAREMATFADLGL